MIGKHRFLKIKFREYWSTYDVGKKEKSLGNVYRSKRPRIAVRKNAIT